MVFEPHQKGSSSWLQNGCLTVELVLRLGIHPEMERPAMREQINAFDCRCDHERPRLTSDASVFRILTEGLAPDEEHHLHLQRKVYLMGRDFSRHRSV